MLQLTVRKLARVIKEILMGTESTKDTDLLGRKENTIKTSKNPRNSFSNICETKEDLLNSENGSDRENLMEFGRDPETLKYSQQLEKEREINQELLDKGTKMKMELHLSGDENENPFEELERIHASKVKEEIGAIHTESWINNYQTENGEEEGATIAGSRLIAGSGIFDSNLHNTTEMMMPRGNAPEERGRGIATKKNQPVRRPVDLVSLGKSWIF